MAAQAEVDNLSEGLRAEIEEAMEGKTVEFDEREDIGDAAAVFLAEKLRGNTTVEILRLILCIFGDDPDTIGTVGARALAEVLGEDNTTLKQLNLRGNSLGDDGAEAMALMLRKNTTLVFLDLSFCNLGDRGVGALGEALKVNTTLKDLHLDANDIGNDGAQTLAEALRWNESLERLSLGDCNELTDACSSSFLAALRESNSTLTFLWLTYGNTGIKDSKIKDSLRDLINENKAVVPETAERRARCLLFCCLQLAPTAHEHVVPSIGAVPVPVMRYSVEHAGKMHVAERFEHRNVAAGLSSARVRARSSSSSSESAEDLDSATSRRCCCQ